MTETEVFLSSIDLDANLAIQTRTEIDPDALERYREALANEREDVERVVLFQDADQNYWIGDGHHRCRAQLAENPDIPIRADVRRGDRLDALRFALKANGKHGLPRTTEDLKTGLTLAETYDLIDPTDKDAVAEILGCGVRRAEQITRPARAKATKERNKRILDLRADGKTFRQIAEILGVSIGTVSNVFKKRNVSQTEQEPEGRTTGGGQIAHQEGTESERAEAEATAEIAQSEKTTSVGTPDERPPLNAEPLHETAERNALPAKPIESDPWEELTSALRAFLASSPEQPTSEQAVAVQRLINEAQALLPDAVDEILARLTAGKPYTAAEAKAAFAQEELRSLAAGEMTEAQAEHFLTYTFQGA